MDKSLKYIFLLPILLFLSGCSAGLQIKSLSVELMDHPVGISTRSPRFGWVLESERKGAAQSAYQIVVKSARDGEEVWNTGKVISDQSQLVEYMGMPLEPETRYIFEVQVWDEQDDISSPGSSYFEMAPSTSSLNANWIGAVSREEANLPKGRKWHAPSLKKNQSMYDSIPSLAKRSIMMRKQLELSGKIERATAYISGLGHYELSLDGVKVGKSEFAPLWTDYDKTIFLNTYDLTEMLTPGEHTLGVVLGNGMYNSVGDRYRKFWVSFGPPTLFFQLKISYADGSSDVIVSDASWKFNESPITFNDIFGGETYDARLEEVGWNEVGFEDSGWKQVVIQKPPKGNLKVQLAPSVQIQKKYDVTEWSHLDTGTYVFQFAQNLSGFPTIRVKGRKGQRIKLIPGERIKEDGSVNQRNTGSPHYYEYILKGDSIEEWQPKFSYYGYQYLQVEGVYYGDGENTHDRPRLVDLKSNFVYSSADEVGAFECSNEIFTKTHTLINNAVKSNMQAVFTDCPHREKLGWLEQIHLVGPGLLYNYDLTQLFAKQMTDMRDAQRENGLVPNIAPEYVDFSAESWGADFTDSPEWGVAVIMVPWLYYEYYGDKRLMEDYYEVMRHYVDYLGSTAENYIVAHGLGDWYDYGQHGAGYSKNSPIALSATSHYYLATKKLAEAARMIGKAGDAQKYEALAEEIRRAFNSEFFNRETNQYGTGSQFSNAAAIYMGIVVPDKKEAVLRNLVRDIREHDNRLTTGDVGNRYLFQVLADHGLNELMFEMHSHYDAPGYGYQLQYGLTTLTEQWDPKKGNSWNHFMLGQIDEWFFKSLVGIRPDMENPGFKHFYIQPEVVGDLTYAKGATKSLYGKIAVSWERKNDAFILEIDVPVNTTATLMLPDLVKADIREVKLSSGHHSLHYEI